MAQDIKLEQLEQRDDELWYKKGTETLYTGRCIENYPNGKKKYEGFLENGKRVKTWTEFYDDEYPRYVGNYKDGKLNGEEIGRAHV